MLHFYLGNHASFILGGEGAGGHLSLLISKLEDSEESRIFSAEPFEESHVICARALLNSALTETPPRAVCGH